MPGLVELARLRTTDCRHVSGSLAALAAGELPLDAPERCHVTQCLRCQAEVAAYRRILRHLRGLRGDLVSPPPGALAALLAAIESGALNGHGGSRALRAAYVGGITVATAAAGAAGMIVWMNRRRPGGLAQVG